VIEIALGKAIVDENMEAEVELTRQEPEYTVTDGRVGLSVQGDTRWDKRSSGRTYNSDSGTTLVCGNKTQKCISLWCMSRRCSFCEAKAARRRRYKEDNIVLTPLQEAKLNKPHQSHLCPRNYHGSSKGMEAYGSFRCVQECWYHKNGYVETYVMDDDSSCRAILRHGIQALFECGRISEEEAKRTKKENDKGILPLSHPPITVLADKNHRIRTYAKKFFELARLAMCKSRVTSGDAERLKRNFSYLCHKQTKKRTSFRKFQRDAKAVFEHHFGDHTWCDKWCSTRRLKDKEMLMAKLRFRDKTGKDKDMYEQCLPHHQAFTTEDALKEIFHELHSNKCESLNGMITKFIPKVKHLCRTLSNKSRTYMAIGLDSVGYEEYFRRLFILLGLEVTQTTTTHHEDLDEKRIRKRAWRKRPEVMKREAEKVFDKIWSIKEQTAKDAVKGFTYSSGMAAPKAAKEENENGVAAVAKKKVVPICPFCDKKGHKTMSAKHCKFSTKKESEHYKVDNEERGTGKSYMEFVLCLRSKYLKETSLTVSTPDYLLSRQMGILDTLPVYDDLSDSSAENSLDDDSDSPKRELYELTMTEMIDLDTEEVMDAETL
jgi:hypothetical protein